MGKEIWDAYLSNGEKAGKVLVRGELIPEGLYHLVVDVAIRHVDGDFLLMKRSQNKATDPGLYELSAGGSALKGESPFDAAKRELFEETGIVLDKFEVVNNFVHEKHKAIYYEFYGITDWDKNSILCQEGETEGFAWASEEDVKQLFQEGKVIASCIRRKKKVFSWCE